MNLKNNRKVQFAVGLTLIILVIRWLITGDLLFAVQVATTPQEEGVKGVGVLSAIWPLLVETCVVVGASAIAWSLGLWNWLANFVDGTKVGDVAVQSTLDREKLIALGRAAVAGNKELVLSLMDEIRGPAVIAAEISEAVKAGDTNRAQVLLDELEAKKKNG